MSGITGEIIRMSGVKKHLAMCALVIWGVIPAWHPAAGQETNNYQLRAIPAVTPLKVDGKLDDWDLSGEILMCGDLAGLMDRYSLRGAAMYDKDFLYLSLS